MKRRVLSFILILALCLNLCPVWVLAADAGTDNGLCPHHLAHTDECGYVSPTVEQGCAHTHDEDCYRTETACIHEHTAECDPQAGDEADEPVSCAHTCTQDSGCVTQTLSCAHEHDDICGYAPGVPGAPCTVVCPLCPIEDLIEKLPDSVSEDNREQIQTQLSEIYALYDELTEEEQQQVDLLPCISLADQMDEMGSAVLEGESYTKLTLPSDKSYDPYRVSTATILDTNGHTLSGVNSCAIQVTQTGKLTIEGQGKVSAPKGAGVEVQSGGTLSVTGAELTIEGKSYALDIASDAGVKLSAGTYIGGTAAIQTANNDFAALLEPGYAYFDASGTLIPLADVGIAKTVVVKKCENHEKGSYTHANGTTEHTWTCLHCAAEETEMCTFNFDETGVGTCRDCNNKLTIIVDETSLGDLIYNGTDQTANVSLTVTLDDGTELGKDTNYAVTHSTRIDVGEITVTVTGITFTGTFTKTYKVNQDTPALKWDTTSKPVPIAVNYDGAPVEAEDLPPVLIKIINVNEDLHEFLQYSHKIQGDADYTDGLPTDAGTYDVIVSLPEMQNFEAAVSDSITLTINPINPIVTPPAAIKPIFNRTEQELVTAGELCDVALRDGLEIQFATSENGPYSTTIPTGTDAGDTYRVWYQVVGTSNYNSVVPTEIEGVEIQRKPITPVIELSQYTYLYDGGFKQPKVTVKDMDHLTILLDSEYNVEYENNRDVGTAKVVVTDKPNGNYEVAQFEVPFEITRRTQETLSITQKPDAVTYGDKFTLATSGGSGNGDVTWEIISGEAVATVNEKSGQVTIIGDGEATVQATKSGSDPTPVTRANNYEDATATWTFTADKKSVTATVTAQDKDYDGNTTATVHAVVEQGVLPKDVITITGLTGTFSDANAGADKTVTVNKENATITGQNSEHYDVSYANAPVQATIRKAVAKITTAPTVATLTYDGREQVLIANGAVVDPAGVPVEYALSETGPYAADFPEATNAGSYTVWYRIQETNNYTGEAPKSV